MNADEPLMPQAGSRFFCHGVGIGVLDPKSQIPPDISPGKEYALRVFSDDPKNMAFTWEQ